MELQGMQLAVKTKVETCWAKYLHTIRWTVLNL